MTLRMEQIARRQLWNQADSEIMAELDLTERQMKYVLSRPEYVRMLEEMRHKLWSALDEDYRQKMKSVQEVATAASVEAMEHIITLMRSAQSQGLQRECANDVLKYSGIEKEEAPPQVINIRAEHIALLVQAAREDDERHQRRPQPVIGGGESRNQGEGA